MEGSVLSLVIVASLLASTTLWTISVGAEVGKIGNYSEKERVALKKFRTIVHEAELYQNYMRGDDYLIRWIRDQKFDLEQARKKLRASLQWRKENRIDSVLQENFADITEQCYYRFPGYDREHRPLVIGSLGGCDARKIVLQGNLPRLFRAMYWAFETAASKVREARNATGLDVRTGIIIADAAGFNLRQHACVRCLELLPVVFDTYENHYPEYVEAAIFINIPRIARVFIDIFLPLVSEKSRKIAKFYGHDKAEWQAEILRRISPDQLPPQFGGTQPKT